MKTLTASAIVSKDADNQPLKDANERIYKRITFTPSPEVDPVTGKRIFNANARPITYNAYAQRYLDDKQDPLFDMEQGDEVEGTVVSEAVPAYKIPERDRTGKPTGNILTIEKDTFIVFGNTDSSAWPAAVTSAKNARIKQREKQAAAAVVGATSAATL